jgi:hypothetical protein
MTIEIEAGASQIQSSTRVISVHLIFAAGIRSARVEGETEKVLRAPKGRC